MADYSKAGADVVQRAIELIEEHYPDLQDAMIGFLMRDDTPAGDRITPGTVKKVGDVEREFLNYDFIIAVTADLWHALGPEQKTACIDHLLAHCLFDSDKGKAKLAKPDFVEFTQVLKRWGIWWPDGGVVREAILQMPLFSGRGKVEALDGPDVLDQLDDMEL